MRVRARRRYEAGIRQAPDPAQVRANPRSNLGMFLLTIFVSVFTIAASIGYAVSSGKTTRNDLCQEIANSRTVLRAVLTFTRDASLEAAKPGRARERSEAFWTTVIAIAPELRCVDGSPVPTQ